MLLLYLPGLNKNWKHESLVAASEISFALFVELWKDSSVFKHKGERKRHRMSQKALMLYQAKDYFLHFGPIVF